MQLGKNLYVNVTKCDHEISFLILFYYLDSRYFFVQLIITCYEDKVNSTVADQGEGNRVKTLSDSVK